MHLLCPLIFGFPVSIYLLSRFVEIYRWHILFAVESNNPDNIHQLNKYMLFHLLKFFFCVSLIGIISIQRELEQNPEGGLKKIALANATRDLV